MMRIDSVAGGTTNCLAGSLLTFERKVMFAIEYCHFASASSRGTRSVKRQNVLSGSEYSFSPSTTCFFGALLIWVLAFHGPRDCNSRLGTLWIGLVTRRTDPCQKTSGPSSLMRW